MIKKEYVRGVGLALLVIGSVLTAAPVGAAAGSTELSLIPANTTTQQGNTVTYEVVVDSAAEGVGAYNLRVNVSDTSTAQIVSASDEIGGQLTKIDKTEDNSSVQLVTAGGSASGPGAVTIATVTVRGVQAGTADVTISGKKNVADEAEQEFYDISGTNNATIDVRQPGLAINNAALSPDTVSSNTTVQHRLTFDALNVSDDGNTDTVTVTIPDAASLESLNTLDVTDATGTDVSIRGTDVSGNTITFDVAPDSGATTRDLTVTTDITLSFPEFPVRTRVPIEIDVSDSTNEQASASVNVTILPPETISVSDLRAPASITQGDRLNVSAKVTNTGADRLTTTVVYRVDGADLASRALTLNSSESKVVEFRLDGATTGALPTGTFTHGVFVAGVNATDQIVIESGASVTFRNRTVENGSTTLTVDSVTAPAGGFVVVHAESDGDIGAPIGNSSYLEPGTSTNVTVRLEQSLTDDQRLIAMVHRDTDGDERYEFPAADGPYVDRQSAPIVDDARITVEGAGPPPIVGQTSPRDVDDDGRYEDIDGDGDFDIVDVSNFLDRFDSQVVEDNERFFDFNGNGEINIVDVAELLDQVP